jgi:cholesterol oxidase
MRMLILFSMKYDFDYIIVGSGFGGSVSALRLSEKGYKVLVLEKGRRWLPEQFPETNWNLKKWLWLPLFRFYGFFKITMMRHVVFLSGVGVGGGSLVYANTLPRPEDSFFKSGSWSGLLNWKEKLEPHYKEAERMLGSNQNPGLYDSDEALQRVSEQYGKSDQFQATNVAVFFGEPEQEVPDPYFEGKGPRRSGCNFCGACMTGCRYNAKNTLDKNYLFLAERNGVEVMAGMKVKRIQSIAEDRGKSGYRISARSRAGIFRRDSHYTTRGIILAGGVVGTVRLLLNMKGRYLNGISKQVGENIRTNNESLVLVHSRQKEKDFSKGVAIGSIFPPGDFTHLEAVRYGSGSGAWKMMGVPLTHGKTMLGRILKLLGRFISNPLSWLRIYTSRNFAKESVILLFMQQIDSTLRFRRGLINLRSAMATGPAPSAFMPFAKELADAVAKEVDGIPFVMNTEAVTGTPLTAHILGGCVIGKDAESGVIDKDHKVYGYHKLYVCDGSAISANPGVNPALTITAMTELAMSKIPHKK